MYQRNIVKRPSEVDYIKIIIIIIIIIMRKCYY